MIKDIIYVLIGFIGMLIALPFAIVLTAYKVADTMSEKYIRWMNKNL
jgi:hypothetical protein